MRRLRPWLLAAVLFGLPLPAWAQSQSATTSQDLNVLNECVAMDIAGMGTGAWQVAGTYVGTVTWTVSSNAGDFVAIDAATPADPVTAVNSVTDSAGLWTAAVASLRQMRACMTSYTSGTATVTLSAAGTGGGGGGGGAAAANASINVSQVSGAAVSATNPVPIRVANSTGFIADDVLDPCSGIAKTFYRVNVATAATFEIANAIASQFFYICSIDLHTAAANNVVIAEDDTDGCGSISAGVTGGTTAATGYNFAANGGRTLGNGLGTIAKTTTAARYLCLLTSAATQLSGSIGYVSAP